MAKVALVTGGSRGIGAAVTELLAAQGWDVCIGFHDNADRAAFMVDTCEQHGRRAIAVPADVSVESNVVDLFRKCDQQLGSLDVLVNSAGIVAPKTRVDELDFQRLQRIMAVNVIGSFLCAREAIRRMSTRHGGHGGAIVNVSSAAARLGSPDEYVDYAASKGAIDTMTIGLAAEIAGEGIRVNAVRPGVIDTEIHASGGQPGRAQRLAPQLPLGRPGQPSEVAHAIAWLCSEQASYVTGALLDVAGGR